MAFGNFTLVDRNIEINSEKNGFVSQVDIGELTNHCALLDILGYFWCDGSIKFGLSID
jgi:hypothetical protein